MSRVLEELHISKCHAPKDGHAGGIAIIYGSIESAETGYSANNSHILSAVFVNSCSGGIFTPQHSAIALPGSDPPSPFALTNGTCVITGIDQWAGQLLSNPSHLNENCIVTVENVGYLTAVSFDAGLSILKVDGKSYSGQAGPVRQVVLPGSQVVWNSSPCSGECIECKHGNGSFCNACCSQQNQCAKGMNYSGENCTNHGGTNCSACNQRWTVLFESFTTPVPTQLGAAGGIAILNSGNNSYNNVLMASHLTISNCRGWVGGLAIVDASTHSNQISCALHESHFHDNQGGLGVVHADGQAAGALGFSLAMKDLESNFTIKGTRFVANSLHVRCTDAHCRAGAVALSGAAASIDLCSFSRNKSPVSSGALFATQGPLALQSSQFNDNEVTSKVIGLPDFSTARIENPEIYNSTMVFSNSKGSTRVLGIDGNLTLATWFTNNSRRSAASLQLSALQLQCPSGTEVVDMGINMDTGIKTFECDTCGNGFYNLGTGEIAM